MEFFDSHAHICDAKFNEDREQVLAGYKEKGISGFIESGYNLNSSLDAIKLANANENIYAVIGISPNDIPQNVNELWNNVDEIEKVLKENIQKKENNKVIAVGEIGLDYYWNKENLDLQKELFVKQIELANKYDLPIVIHSRDAWIDTIEILKENNVNRKGVFHCCQLNMELIRNALDLEYYISIAGPITFKNVKNAEEIINMIPNDRILIETDSPYLSPEPNRGKRNDSSNVRFVAEKIAEIKNIPVEEVAKMTRENINEIFGV